MAAESFWAQVWAWLKWLGAKLIVPGVALLVIAVAILLVSFGVKELQIGGLLGWLFGHKDPEHKAIDIINTPPSNRVDKNGNIIPVGTPDDKGMTQVVVVPIQDTGLFSDPNQVTITPPGTTTPINIQLPTGVKNSDVDKVVVVQPGKFVVTVKDNSGIPTSKLDDVIARYGG